jgi:hypothetical protein
VVVPAIELDDQPLGLELGVDLVAADLDVDLRARKTEPLAEGGKISLPV